eukprot:207684-Rhodomonas_salina.1
MSANFTRLVMEDATCSSTCEWWLTCAARTNSGCPAHPKVAVQPNAMSVPGSKAQKTRKQCQLITSFWLSEPAVSSLRVCLCTPLSLRFPLSITSQLHPICSLHSDLVLQVRVASCHGLCVGWLLVAQSQCQHGTFEAKRSLCQISGVDTMLPPVCQHALSAPYILDSAHGQTAQFSSA